LFATGDADGQVAVWDLNRSHLMQPHSELKNGHVCLGFVHGGHKERYILCIWLQSHSSLSSIVFDLHFTLTESLTWLGVPILIKTGP
jgi:hypothetical protein